MGKHFGGSVLVSINDRSFIVEDPDTHEKKELPLRDFYGISFKYDSDFKAAFLKVFPEKSTVILNDESLKTMEDIMEFNRIDG